MRKFLLPALVLLLVAAVGWGTTRLAPASAAPAAATGPAAEDPGTTIYACINTYHQFVKATTGTPLPCPSGAYPVSWAGTSGSPSPSPSASSTSASPSPSATSASPSPTATSASPSPTSSTTSASPSPSTSTTAAWAWCSTDRSGFRQFGDLALYNDEWNSKDSAVQTICGNSASDWQASTTLPSGVTEIMTYPDVQLNYNTSMPPVSSLNPAATSSFAENMNVNPDTSAEAAYDIWVSGTNCNRCEVMIWTDTYNRGTVGGSADTGHRGTFCGDSTWQLWHFGSELIWYHPANMTSGQVCPAAMLQDLQAGGYLPANAAVSQFEYGFEVASTGGSPETFQVTDYSVTGFPSHN